MVVDKKENEIIKSGQDILRTRATIRSKKERYDTIRYRYEREYINERLRLKEEIQKQEEILALLKAHHVKLLNAL